jgi:hypothetical protein
LLREIRYKRLSGRRHWFFAVYSRVQSAHQILNELTMLLIDDLLLSPISGFKFILRTLVRAAEEQYTDDAPIKERLLELQTELEEGLISEDEYVEQERQVLAELREIQNRRMQMAGITPEEAERMGRPMLEIAVEIPKKTGRR